MIDAAIWFALASMVLGGCNEVVFKRYSAKIRSRGMMIAGIGVVWSLLLLVDVGLRADRIEFDQVGLVYGLVAGLFVALANILLLESLRHLEVSLGSTIYRLNTIAVVILSVAFLGEAMSGLKFSGISCGVIAVLLLYRHQFQLPSRDGLRLGLTMVCAGALARAIYGVTTKAGLNAGADIDLLLLIGAMCWIVSGLIYARFIERRYAITRQKIGYALVSGVLVYGIVRTLLSGLARGEASIVITIANLSFLTALITAWLLKMERLSGKKLLAMVFAVAAITLLTRA